MKQFAVALISLPILLASCNKNNNDPEPTPKGETRFVMFTEAGTFPNKTSYLSGLPDLENGSYRNSNALEFTQGGSLWSYGGHAFVNFYGAPATMRKFVFDENGMASVEGELRAPGGNTFSTTCFVSDTEAYAGVSSSGSALNIVRFNPTTMERTGEISLDPILKPGIPTIFIQQIVKRGNKLFMGLYYEKDLKPGINEVTVAVIDIATQKVEKLITDTRSSRIFHVGFAMSSLVVTDNGDIYVAADGWIANSGDGTTGKPSGILRIKNNEEDFDPDFFMNLDELTGAKCNGIAMYGNGKAVTMRLVDSGDQWEMEGPNFQYAKLDLSTGQYNGLVEGLPEVYGPLNGSFLKQMDGEWLINAGGINRSSVYIFDPASENVSKKFDVVGKLSGLVELQ